MKKLLLYLMAAIYILLGINHFRNQESYMAVMPDFVPAHALMVQLSGVAEIVLGALLLFPRTRSFAAWGIIAMLGVFMLVHVDWALRPHLYPAWPYWLVILRIPIQFVLILWAWWYTRPIPRRAET